MPRILVVDDDPSLREVVRYALAREGYDVEEAGDGVAAIAAATARPPDLVVLDVRMPELDGLEVCRRLRATSTVPIVFLSTRGDEIDRVLGLELGGDDYLPKPFSTRELVSRIRAVLRRTRPASTTPASERIELGRLRIDLDEARVWVDDAEVVLTPTELRLLTALTRRPGRVFARDELMDRAYPDARHVSSRTLDSHVRGVRAKLAEAGLVDAIETVHGLGYRARRSP